MPRGPERANDVKLGRGGIREIEFTVQLLQVVRGGQFPELRMRPTLQALTALVQARLMPADTALALHEAYVFLRQVEHRIQYLDDQQTHQLPTEAADLQWIAQSLGWPDNAALQAQLQRHRDAVALEFERLLRNEDDSPNTGHSSTPTDFEMLLEGLSPELHGRIARWAALPRVLALRDEALQRLLKLVQRTQAWVTQGVISETAAVRWSDWMEPLLRRETYLALLLERPSVHAQLLRLLGAARWPARYLMKHPGVIDELADPSMLDERFDAPLFKHNLQTRYLALQSAQADDDESLLNLLRRAHHAELFLTLARDLEGRLSVEQVADDLSALADAIVEVAASWVWPRVKTRHRDTPCFAIMGYGKWGGKELGYGSDLDIVFVFQDEHPQAHEIYALFARKLIQWLTLKTGEGDVYEIDTALRPNGSAGLLVSSMEAFAAYQAQRGSNSAWVWEHQAMTRARFCVGDAALGEAFEAVRRQVLCAPRDLAQLAVDITQMRDKMRSAHPVPAGLFDYKHSVGGMIDAEFVVQHLVLAHAQAHPALQDNVGNIALLHRAEAAGLLAKGVGQRRQTLTAPCATCNTRPAWMNASVAVKKPPCWCTAARSRPCGLLYFLDQGGGGVASTKGIAWDAPAIGANHLGFGQAVHVVVAAFDQHVRAQFGDELQWRVFLEPSHQTDRCQSGQQDGAIGLRCSRVDRGLCPSVWRTHRCSNPPPSCHQVAAPSPSRWRGHGAAHRTRHW